MSRCGHRHGPGCPPNVGGAHPPGSRVYRSTTWPVCFRTRGLPWIAAPPIAARLVRAAAPLLTRAALFTRPADTLRPTHPRQASPFRGAERAIAAPLSSPPAVVPQLRHQKARAGRIGCCHVIVRVVFGDGGSDRLRADRLAETVVQARATIGLEPPCQVDLQDSGQVAANNSART